MRERRLPKDPGDFETVFLACADEEFWTAKAPIPADLQEPGVRWVKEAAARGADVDAARRVWLATQSDSAGEVVDIEPLATPLALAVACGLDLVASALIEAGADPFWGFDLAEFGSSGKVEICHLAVGWSDHGWRGKCCLDLVRAAREGVEIAQAAQGAAAPASKARPGL